MSRKERVERGNHVRTATRPSEGPAAAGGAGNDELAIGASEAADAKRRAACTALSYLLMRTDGWLRAVPTDDGRSLYLKWKFTRGEWTNHYVMALVRTWEWDYGVALLLEKMMAVDDGVRKPTEDRYHEGSHWEQFTRHLDEK